MRILIFTFISIQVIILHSSLAQDTLIYSGQISGWMNLKESADLPVWLGGRYLSQIDFQLQQENNQLLDFEISANIFGNLAFHPFDSLTHSGKIKPYRFWGRYSTRQLEIRLGLQKINFGSAAMLRPLMWFDQVDPRDPLQLTDGVWGLLGRYYFLNNANVWLWVLYGNEEPKTWETSNTSQKFPEVGGRIQVPVNNGEAALSYHFRMTDPDRLTSDIAENRVGIDAKWDLGVGLWIEGAWIFKSKNVDMYNHQKLLNTGLDYILNVGNGLNVIAEQLWVSYTEKPSSFDNLITFTGLSGNYPLGLFSNINAIVYFDWSGDSLYKFVNWKKDIKNLSLYLMAYWNPENYQIPLQESSGNSYGGKGIQVMLVWNH